MERKKQKGTMPSQLTYKPLSDNLQVSYSSIEGMGIFAVKNIKRGANLGMTHLKLGKRTIRTPLGGFLNHSETPNCEKVKLRFTEDNCNYTFWNLITLKEIKLKEELTIKYEWYKPNESK